MVMVNGQYVKTHEKAAWYKRRRGFLSFKVMVMVGSHKRDAKREILQVEEDVKDANLNCKGASLPS
jgi:hypothetical protein